MVYPVGDETQPLTLGPDLQDFPSGYNPMTGEPVVEPSLLDIPAVLFSISNHPPDARPQAGLSFAPTVYEIYIGGGMTRFLTVFYGDYPHVKLPADVSGGQPMRTEPFEQSGLILGNQIWFDQDGDGVQALDELGLPGVKVDLYLADSGDLLESTTTDSNGYYGFNVESGIRYLVAVTVPEDFALSPQDVGEDEAADSDFDPASGYSPVVMVEGDTFSLDAGLYWLGQSLQDDGDAAASGATIGDLVWLDENGDGLQDADEPGVPGVQVDLIDQDTQNVIATTVTDAEGYYRFTGITPNKHYSLEFYSLPGFVFTDSNAGEDDSLDSDTDNHNPYVENTEAFYLTEDDLTRDAGLEVSIIPIRSGRLPYPYIRDRFPGACLAFAGKHWSVYIPGCFVNVNHDWINENSAFMPVSRLRTIGEQLLASAQQYYSSGWQVDYSGNSFSEQPPSGGQEATQLIMKYANLNQTQWIYDPLAGAYQRFYEETAVDANGNTSFTGEFIPAVDRLTGRQLLFENVVILFADHTPLREYIIDIELRYNHERALLFRNGQVYEIFWETRSNEYEKETGLPRPIRFVDAEGNPIPLDPGQTWVHIVTLGTSFTETEPGSWLAHFLSLGAPTGGPLPGIEE